MYLPNYDIDAIAASVEAMHIRDGECLVVYLATADTNQLADLASLFQKLPHPAVGGVFPGLILGKNVVECGVSFQIIPCQGSPILFRANQSEHIYFEEEFPEVPAGLVFIDGLSPTVENMLTSIYERWGGITQFFGGGCGFPDLVQKPCLITRQGIFQDAALLIPIPQNIKIGVRHGWEQLVGPLVATSTKGNDVLELNWEPAYQVYKNAILKDSGIELDAYPFFDIAKQYPFGIFKEGNEDLVRDPIARHANGILTCVGHVPENTMLYVLKGRAEELILAARKAALDCLADHSRQPQHIFVFDCISRRLFLEEAFEEELKAVTQSFEEIDDTLEPIGALSIGEISTMDKRELAFFNKTIVVGATYA